MIILALLALILIYRIGVGRFAKLALIGIGLFVMLCHELTVHGPEIDARHARDFPERVAAPAERR